MFDVYSAVPLPVIYVIGSSLLIWIMWSILRDADKADLKTRRKMLALCGGLAVVSIVLVWGVGHFNVSEKLFPSFYERARLQQDIDESPMPWDENYNPNEWQQPFNGIED